MRLHVLLCMACRQGKNAHFLWARAVCSLILPSVSAWEVVAKEKRATEGCYMCRYCQVFWKAGRRGSGLVTRAEKLYNNCIEFKKRCASQLRPTLAHLQLWSLMSVGNLPSASSRASTSLAGERRERDQ